MLQDTYWQEKLNKCRESFRSLASNSAAILSTSGADTPACQDFEDVRDLLINWNTKTKEDISFLRNTLCRGDQKNSIEARASMVLQGFGVPNQIAVAQFNRHSIAYDEYISALAELPKDVGIETEFGKWCVVCALSMQADLLVRSLSAWVFLAYEIKSNCYCGEITQPQSHGLFWQKLPTYSATLRDTIDKNITELQNQPIVFAERMSVLMHPRHNEHDGQYISTLLTGHFFWDILIGEKLNNNLLWKGCSRNDNIWTDLCKVLGKGYTDPNIIAHPELFSPFTDPMDRLFGRRNWELPGFGNLLHLFHLSDPGDKDPITWVRQDILGGKAIPIIKLYDACQRVHDELPNDRKLIEVLISRLQKVSPVEAEGDEYYDESYINFQVENLQRLLG